MNAILRTALCAAVLAGSLCAAEPASGKVLLIDNDRLLEGEIERTGNRFRIRSRGGEMTIPATPKMLLLPDKEAAYRHLRSQAKLNDPLERVRLARWCAANSLMAYAVKEAEAALALRPADRSLMELVDEFKRRAELAPPPSVVIPASAMKPAESMTPAATTADVNPESFTLFVTKVQPLLLNACGQCHTGDRGGKFNLARTVVTFGDKRATQLNLVAASAFLDREQPSNSPLLQRAVTIHGNCTRPPLIDRQSPAFKHLEEWARLATGKPLAAPAPLPPAAITVSQPLTPESSPPVTDYSVVPALATEAVKPMPPAAPKTETGDPFDPNLFNQQKASPKK